MTQPWLVITGVLMLGSIVYLIVLATNRIRTTERLRCPEKKIDVKVDFATATSATWTPGERLDVLAVRCVCRPGARHLQSGLRVPACELNLGLTAKRRRSQVGPDFWSALSDLWSAASD